MGIGSSYWSHENRAQPCCGSGRADCHGVAFVALLAARHCAASVILELMSTSRPSRILLKVVGSLLAAFAGTLAGMAYMVLFGWEDWRICLMLIAFFAVPVWALVLLPLYVLLPRSSVFWYPSASAGVGAAVGAVLFLAFFLIAGAGLLYIFLPVGVLVGVVTGLAGSGIARFYAEQSG